MKAMLASDYNPAKLRFPCGIQPKIDGVRGLNMGSGLIGRSLKRHDNLATTEFYSREIFIGLDGELVVGHHTHPDACRTTSSGVGRGAGDPRADWWVFDYITAQTVGLCYWDRYKALMANMSEIWRRVPDLVSRVKIVPMIICDTQDKLDYWEDIWLNEGYEGVIIRDLNGKHKQGRSTVREMGLLRIKRFVESEALITGIVEGSTNNNKAQVNERGLQFRSSHQENKVPNGMVGHFVGTACETIKDAISGKVIITAGQEITIAPGNLTHAQRKFYFENPGEALGNIAKYKFFPKGIKDKPRFPTFQTFKTKSDI